MSHRGLHGTVIPKQVADARLPALYELMARSPQDCLVVASELRRRWLKKQERKARRSAEL